LELVFGYHRNRCSRWSGTYNDKDGKTRKTELCKGLYKEIPCRNILVIIAHIVNHGWPAKIVVNCFFANSFAYYRYFLVARVLLAAIKLNH
jgi:hypothetical protein